MTRKGINLSKMASELFPLEALTVIVTDNADTKSEGDLWMSLGGI
jgi:hypothetical protein